MISTKILLAAASLSVAMAADAASANAAPWDQHDNQGQAMGHDMHHDLNNDRRDMNRHDVNRRIVDRDRVFETLRLHHYRGLGDPSFVRGHYVVRVAGHFGRPIYLEINPYTGALIGEIRI
jgi:hypothetical protein